MAKQVHGASSSPPAVSQEQRKQIDNTNERHAQDIQRLLTMLAALASAEDLQMLVRLLGERASRAGRTRQCQEWIDGFGRAKQRARVYLALDGQRNVNEIAEHLEMRPQNVTRELKSLKEHGLVGVAETNGKEIHYSKKFFDSVVGLSEALAAKFDLDETGLAKK